MTASGNKKVMFDDLVRAAALLELGWRCRRRTNAADLGKLSANDISTATAAVMPALLFRAVRLAPNVPFQRPPQRHPGRDQR